MSKLQTILAITAISTLSSFTTNNAEQQILDYVELYRTIAIQEMNRTGVPASITLAQGIIESRYGMSGLAKNSNNHFGIKCKGNWTGGKYYHKDDDYVNGKLVKSCFRTYDNPEDSYYDHSEFLLVNKRYHSLFSLAPTDYKGWAKGLKKAGYATAKNYATMLINTIEKYATASIPSETLVASAPPPATLIPKNYRAGDGLREAVKGKTKRDFYTDVYGKSSQYLEEITPTIAGRE